MRSYSVTSVERLLRNYLDFRHNLLDGGSSATAIVADEVVMPAQAAVAPAGRVPLGWTANDPRWPFMEPRHAQTKVDGKRRAQLLTEIHVSVLDLEAGLKCLADDDLELIYKYHIFQTRSLDELCRERGLHSRGSMSRRVERAVRRLCHAMEHGGCHDPL